MQIIEAPQKKLNGEAGKAGIASAMSLISADRPGFTSPATRIPAGFVSTISLQ